MLAASLFLSVTPANEKTGSCLQPMANVKESGRERKGEGSHGFTLDVLGKRESTTELQLEEIEERRAKAGGKKKNMKLSFHDNKDMVFHIPQQQ